MRWKPTRRGGVEAIAPNKVHLRVIQRRGNPNTKSARWANHCPMRWCAWVQRKYLGLFKTCARAKAAAEKYALTGKRLKLFRRTARAHKN